MFTIWISISPSVPLSHNPLIMMSALLLLLLLFVFVFWLLLLFPSLVGFVRGSSRMEFRPKALMPMSISSSFTSLCLQIISPPILQFKMWSMVASFPHPSQYFGMDSGLMLYLQQALSRHSSFPSSVPARVLGVTLSHAPVLDALSIILLLGSG